MNNTPLEDREFFVVTFAIDEVVPPGQQPRAMHVPAFVKDFQAAAEAAADYLADFPNKPEAKQLKPDEKLKLQQIMVGGSILL